eukprot:4413678-Amphidinium_carterae.1
MLRDFARALLSVVVRLGSDTLAHPPYVGRVPRFFDLVAFVVGYFFLLTVVEVGAKRASRAPLGPLYRVSKPLRDALGSVVSFKPVLNTRVLHMARIVERIELLDNVSAARSAQTQAFRLVATMQ